ncbi:MAG: C1 family peptidase [Mariniblastus sp.]
MRNTSRVLLLALFFGLPSFSGTSFAQEDLIQAEAKRESERTAESAKESKAKKEVKRRKPKYDFTIEHNVTCTEVKSQDRTGTCWSFATASFIESELIRREKGEHNLSEMFIVKNIYRDKAQNFVLRNGKANFSQGALAHDFIRSAHRYGLVPEEVFSGREDEEAKHDHGEMEAVMLGFLEAVVKRKTLSDKWQVASDKILDTYLGESPSRFTYRDRSYNAKEFAKSLEFRGDDYLSVTSYQHHPFYEDFVLEIPDNYSNGSFYNLPIDDLVEIIDNAIESGYSVAWDGDVSEKGFSSARGIAVMPKNPSRRDLFTSPGEEIEYDQDMRQKNFMSYNTTDDHLMHLVGISRDQEGNKYYVIKNSWGEVGPYEGFLHMSEAYVRAKTVAVIVHKDAVPPRLKRD